MSQNRSILTLATTATDAITAGRFVIGAGTHAVAAGVARGVAVTDGAIGDLVPTDVLGTAVVTAGAAIAANALLEVGAAGKAVTKAAGVTVAVALAAAGAADEPIEVLLIPNG